MLLRLYHGSKAGLLGEIRPVSRATCDFGRAFYMGESEQQPLTLVCHAAHPRLYTLEVETEGLVARSVENELVWALFVAFNRGAMPDFVETPLGRRLANLAKDADLLTGRIANDRVFQTVQMFFERTITLETLGEVLKAVNLDRQVCAVSPRACSRIRVVAMRELTDRDCELLRLKSETQRHRATELTNRIIDSRRHADGIYFDELCAKYRDGEGLPL